MPNFSCSRFTGKSLAPAKARSPWAFCMPARAFGTAHVCVHPHIRTGECVFSPCGFAFTSCQGGFTTRRWTYTHSEPCPRHACAAVQASLVAPVPSHSTLGKFSSVQFSPASVYWAPTIYVDGAWHWECWNSKKMRPQVTVQRRE